MQLTRCACTLLLLVLSAFAVAQTELPRRGYLGAMLRFNSTRHAAEVTSVTPGSAAASIGLMKGDVLVSVNGHAIASSDDVDALDRLPSRKPLHLRITRNGMTSETTVSLPELRREQHEGINVSYGYVATPAGRVRTITTAPANPQAKLPGLFLVGWLSCDSVESPMGPSDSDGMNRAIARLVKESGFLFMRMDKPGVGDSEGDCSRTDFSTELAAYRAAFANFLSDPTLDSSRVLLIGMSNGGGVAPLVAGNTPVRGYVSASGWGRTWYEHMIDHERLRLRLSGKSPGEVTDGVRGFTLFYSEYLAGKKTPAQVIASHPELKPLWYDAPDGQYGRPAAFYQQLNDLNLAAAWSAVTAPVLVIRGDQDFIMSHADAEAIVHAVNSAHPGNATFVERPRMDHGFMLHDTMEDEFRHTPGKLDGEVVDVMLSFLKKESSRQTAHSSN